jgi:hypothetical protein
MNTDEHGFLSLSGLAYLQLGDSRMNQAPWERHHPKIAQSFMAGNIATQSSKSRQGRQIIFFRP